MIPYRAMLDVPAELLRYLSRLLAAERRDRATPAKQEASVPFSLISADALDRVLGAWLWTRAVQAGGRLVIAATSSCMNTTLPSP